MSGVPNTGIIATARVRSSRPTLCIGIPTYMRGEVMISTLKQCLEQVPPAEEIIVVDQTPEHLPEVASFLEMAERQGSIRYLRQSPPGLTAARNRVIKESTSDIIVFIDDDVILPGTSFAERHRELYIQNPSLAAVNGIVLSAPGAYGPRYTTNEARRRGTRVSASSPIDVAGIPMVYGCHFSIRRAAAIAIGGWDERLIGSGYGEDIDFAMRLGGSRILRSSSVELVHLRSPAGGCKTTDGRKGMPEWKRSVSPLAVVFRHGWRDVGIALSWSLVALRCGPLRRNVCSNPFRLSWAIASFAFAVVAASKIAFVGPASSLGMKSPASFSRLLASLARLIRW